jgi:inosine-uridine nucleoside N-ribohydrolase
MSSPCRRPTIASRHQAQQDHAARFIIKTVRENPGQVTIYAGGPLTNLALAIALAPDIVPLVPEVVIMGTGFHVFTNTFNIFFDPEAARKVLRARVAEIQHRHRGPGRRDSRRR